MKAQQVHFFALNQDISPTLLEFQEVSGCTWHRTRSTEAHLVREPISLEQLFPDLGRSASGQLSRDPLGLCLHSEAEPVVRSLERRSGEVVFLLEQDENPDSLLLVPGGVYDSSLVAGRAATMSDTKRSKELLLLFRRVVLSPFRKVGQFYIGPSAEAMARQGARLVTMGVDEPSEYDLSLA